MKILLTAFDPFGGEPLNPALEAVIRIPSAIGGIQVAKQEIPTVFCKSIRVAAAAIDKEKPDAVLCIGQAGGRHGLTPERVAINIDDARIPDNEGNQPIDRPICPDGPPAYFSTLPIKAMTQKIRAAGIPASVSNSAGTFVCNHLMYGVLHHQALCHPHIRGGFLHVPYAPGQAAARPEPTPCLGVRDIALGIEAALAAIAEYRCDITAAEGKIH